MGFRFTIEKAQSCEPRANHLDPFSQGGDAQDGNAVASAPFRENPPPSPVCQIWAFKTLVGNQQKTFKARFGRGVGIGWRIPF